LELAYDQHLLPHREVKVIVLGQKYKINAKNLHNNFFFEHIFICMAL
jgi:hypothetical protein